MGKIGYSDWNSTEKKYDSTSSDKITFFSVKENSEATVRFVYDSVDDIEITAAHLIKTPSLKYGRYVDCFKESAQSPIDDCPLCKAGYEVSNRFYVKLIQYVTDDVGNISIMPKVWDRAAGYAKQIANLIREYGSLKNCIFKIKRSGSGLATEYSIMLASPTVFKDENYPKNFSAFDNFDASKFIHRTKEDVEEFLKTGELPVPKRKDDSKHEYKKESGEIVHKGAGNAYGVTTGGGGVNTVKPLYESNSGGCGRQSGDNNNNGNNGFRPNRYY